MAGILEDPDFTPRNVAKYAVKTIIHGNVAKFAKNAMTDYTQFEDTDMTVKVTSNVIGWYVSAKLKPHTDKVVDKAADFIVAKREARAAKKAAEKKTEEEK